MLFLVPFTLSLVPCSWEPGTRDYALLFSCNSHPDSIGFLMGDIANGGQFSREYAVAVHRGGLGR